MTIMEYNTERDKLIISEYGRNIQKLISKAIEIEDREKRTKYAEMIIKVMSQLAPQQKDTGDYKHKLWDHLHIISDFKLYVDSPYPIPDEKIIASKPDKIDYSNKTLKFRHYGKNIQEIIKQVGQLEESEEKKSISKLLANQLKKSYLTWNRDSVTDVAIIDHLASISEGKIILDSDTKLINTYDVLAKTKTKNITKSSNNSKWKKKNYKGGHSKKRR